MAESEFADHQTSRIAPGTSTAEWTLSTVRCWPAKLAAALSSSTADDRTANGGSKVAIALATFSMALSAAEAKASTKSPEIATPGGTGRPWRAASPSPTALDPKSDLSLAFVNGTTFFTLTEHRDFTGISVHADTNAIGDAFGGLAGADDARNAVLARDDCGMRKKAAAVGHDSAKEWQEDVE